MPFPPQLADIDSWNAEVAEVEGGSLPSWWTVDSTPGDENVTFGGRVAVQAPPGASLIFEALDNDQNYGLAVEPRTTTITADGTADALSLQTGVGLDEVLTIGPTGAVTISPSDTAVALLTGIHAADTSDFAVLIDMKAANDLVNGVLYLDTAGNFNLVMAEDSTTFDVSPGASSALRVMNSSGVPHIGFYDKALTPTAKPTGVAVSAPGIHAALVTLGLIAA
jgi:hypothetical protein